MPIKKFTPFPVATFAQRLRKVMAEKGLNQSEVARQIGYTPTGVWNWLQGNTFPRAETLSALANLLDVSEEWLRDGEVVGVEQEFVSEPSGPAETIADRVESLRAEVATLTGYSINRVKLTLEFVAD